MSAPPPVQRPRPALPRLAMMVLAAVMLMASALTGPALPLRNPQAQQEVHRVLNDPSFWDSAKKWTYTGELYDEMRMAQVGADYLPMITGEGDRDIPQALVADVIYEQFHQLPAYSGRVKHIAQLGRGYDPLIGAEYRDTWFFLDSVVMYVSFTWRAYRTQDPQGREVIWFEKLKPETLSPAERGRYMRRVAELRADMATRWIGNTVVEPAQVYGVFVVEPGQVHQSRVTFVTRLNFGPESGWLVNYATELPFVLRHALAEVFGAAVQLSDDEQRRRERSATH